MNTPCRSFFTFSLLAVGVSVGASDLANAPMYLGSQVPPNIMIIADDSGSMNWEDILTPGARLLWSSSSDWPGASQTVQGGYNSIDPFFEIDNKDTVAKLVDTRLRCSGINGLFFDPTKEYKPWRGVDANGKPFANQNIKSARINPYLFGSNNTVDLTSEKRNWRGELEWAAGYFKWNDANSNGVYDAGECLDGFVDGNNVSIIRNNILSSFVPVSQMSAQAQQNFANWYSYYRKREYTSKAVLSEVIDESTARVGLMTLHDNGTANRVIKDINDKTQPVNLTAQKNKQDLLKGLFSNFSSGGTPLRQRLYDVGEMYAGSDSPILPIDQGGQCQQNYSLLMTDGLWNGWRYWSDQQSVWVDNTPDAVKNKIGNQDTSANKWAAGAQYRDKQNGVSNTLADIALYYYGTDFKPTYKNLVNKPDSGKNPAQHMITYTVSFGALGTVSSVDEALKKDFKGWPTPQHDQPTTIDDLMHAAVNGRGAFYAASDASKLSASLRDAFSSMQQQSSSSSSVAATGSSLQADTTLFSAEFESEHWSGQLKAYEFNDQKEIVFKGYASIVPEWNKRTIFTSSDVSTNRKGTLFNWESISAAQQLLLKSDESLLDYIRGDQSEEATGKFRKRPLLQITPQLKAGSPLGSLINSSPAYVANPNLYYIDTPSSTPKYADFLADPDGDGKVYRTTNQGQKLLREPMIYVGSNDGMLHAFNADSDDTLNFGQERFAFVPSAVYARLPKLAEKNFQHVYTVDGSPVVSDVVIKEKWQTVLVAGLNAGGQGIFALNINDPKKFTNSKAMAEDVVMWEFTDTNDADMGYSFSQPVIAKMNNDQWVAIFGNGYNNTENDGSVGSGHAVLYVVDIATGAVVKKFDTGVNDVSNKANGMSSATTVDVNRDGKVDYIYAGDLEGNLWKFDVTNKDASNWDIAYFKSQIGNTASKEYKPLFTACSEVLCTESNRQPITAKPQIRFNKSASGHLVLFGTGSFVALQDRADKKQQSFYAIWDRHINNTSHQLIHRNQLLQQRMQARVTNTANQKTLRVTSQLPIKWHDAEQGYPIATTTASDTHLGWFIDLNQPTATSGQVVLEGERVITAALLRDDNVNFYTMTPGSSDPCAAGGRSALFVLNAFSGAAPHIPVLDADDNGVINNNDNVNYTDSDGNKVDRPPSGKEYDSIVTGGTFLNIGQIDFLIGNPSDGKGPGGDNLASRGAVGRWSWKELN